jgi:MoxR-like ATPase
MLIEVPNTVYDALWELRGALSAEGVVLSDRRWKRIVKAIKAVSYLTGHDVADPGDLVSLESCLWQEPKQVAVVSKTLYSTVDTTLVTMNELVLAAQEQLTKFGESPRGLKESTEHGRTLRTIKDKAQKIVNKSGPRHKSKMIQMFSVINDAWRLVIQQAADAVGAKV